MHLTVQCFLTNGLLNKLRFEICTFISTRESASDRGSSSHVSDGTSTLNLGLPMHVDDRDTVG